MISCRCFRRLPRERNQDAMPRKGENNRKTNGEKQENRENKRETQGKQQCWLNLTNRSPYLHCIYFTLRPNLAMAAYFPDLYFLSARGCCRQWNLAFSWNKSFVLFFWMNRCVFTFVCVCLQERVNRTQIWGPRCFPFPWQRCSVYCSQFVPPPHTCRFSTSPSSCRCSTDLSFTAAMQPSSVLREYKTQTCTAQT